MPLTLIEQLDRVDPDWRDTVSKNPLEAAVELCLIEPEDLEDYRELDFS